MTATERRRNMRADVCRVCHCPVEAMAGFLYRDTATTKGRNYRRRTGKWGWFVKCANCHNEGETKSSLAAKEARAPKWSVRDVAKWGFESGQVATMGVCLGRAGRIGNPSYYLQWGETFEQGEWKQITREVLIRVAGENMGGAPAVWLTAPEGSQIVAEHDYRGVFRGQCFGGLDVVFGRELTDKAASLLNERLAPMVEAIRQSEANKAAQ